MSHAIKPPDPDISTALKLFLVAALVCFVGTWAYANESGGSWGMNANIVGISMMMFAIIMAVLDMYDDS